MCGRSSWTGTSLCQAWGDAITPFQCSWDGQGQRGLAGPKSGYNTRWLLHRGGFSIINPACPTCVRAGLCRAARQGRRHPNLLTLPSWDGQSSLGPIPAEAAAGGVSLSTLLLFLAGLMEHPGASHSTCPPSASDAAVRWLLTLSVPTLGSPSEQVGPRLSLPFTQAGHSPLLPNPVRLSPGQDLSLALNPACAWLCRSSCPGLHAWGAQGNAQERPLGTNPPGRSATAPAFHPGALDKSLWQCRGWRAAPGAFLGVEQSPFLTEHCMDLQHSYCNTQSPG